MGWLWGSGPVFGLDWRRTARGKGLYLCRAGAVALAMWPLTAFLLAVPLAIRSQALPRLTRDAYNIVVLVELVMALGLGPAMTAGAICGERRRRRLDDLLVTGLEPRGIVLGKLGAGLAGLAMVVGAVVPLLLMTAALGGVGPDEVVAGSIVVVGVAALGSALALLFSVGARRSVEAMATAAASVLALSLVANAWKQYLGTPPLLIRATDPWSLLFDRARTGFSAEWLVFVAASLASTAGLTAVAGWSLRPDGSRWRDRSRDRRSRRLHASPAPARGGMRRPSLIPRRGGRLAGFATRAASVGPAVAHLAGRLLDRLDAMLGRRVGMPEPTLDAAPVLWRAWRRDGSAWMRWLWLGYAVAAIGSSAFYLGHWQEAMVNGYLVSAGVLLVGLSAATAWEDERGRGGFVPLLTTPLGSREIVRGTWWGAYRVVPRLALLPTLIVLLRGLVWGQPDAAVPMAAAAGALVLAYGAVATGIGLLIGLREPRPGRAVGWTLAILVGANDVWPWFWSQVVGIHLIGADRWVYLPLAWVSPWMGTYLTTAWVFFLRRQPELAPYLAAVPAWAALLGAIGWALRRSMERGFDRRTGRMPEGPDAGTGPEADPRPATDPSPSISGPGMLRLVAQAVLPQSRCMSGIY